MAAGLGFKTFNTGDVLSAADVNGYLMQGVWVFADAAARSTAVTSPQEGNFSYLKDTNKLYYYTGSAWAEADTTGIPASAFTAKGDLLVGTGSGTYDDLTVGGTNGHVLTVDSSTSTGLKWAAVAAGGGKLGQVVSAVTTTLTTSNSTTFADATNFTVSITPSANTSKVLVLCDVAAEAYFPSGGGTGAMGLRIVRGSTAIYTKDIALAHDHSGSSGAQNVIAQQQLIYLDSPSTTSSTTYKIQLKAGAASHTGRVNPNNQDSSITVMEILA